MEIRFAFSIVASCFLTCAMLVACGSRTELSSPRGFVDGDDAGGIDASALDTRTDVPVAPGDAETLPAADAPAAGGRVTTRLLRNAPCSAHLYRASIPC